MGKPANLYTFHSGYALVYALRSHIIAAQNASLIRHGIFRIAVSVGLLPKDVLTESLLAASSGPDDIVRFDKWEVFFTDEHAVLLDDPNSNYGVLKRELLDKIPTGVGMPTVHPIDVNHLDDMQELANQYEQVLVHSFARRDSVKLPIFDFLLLGCGFDGHTCSLFPGHSLLNETSMWVASLEDAPEAPQKRITLTLPVVTHSINVVFVVSGSGKREILKQVFEDGNSLPCALVNEAMHDRCSWLIDTAASEGVSFPRRLAPS